MSNYSIDDDLSFSLSRIQLVGDKEAKRYLKQAKELIKKWIEVDDKDKILDLSNLQLKYVPELPDNIKYLNLEKNNITTVYSFPPNLRSLNIKNNKLVELPILPENLKRLEVDFNELEDLPTLPTSLKYLSAKYNKLIKLPKLPSNIKELYLTGNPPIELPIKINEQFIKTGKSDYPKTYFAPLTSDEEERRNTRPSEEFTKEDKDLEDKLNKVLESKYDSENDDYKPIIRKKKRVERDEDIDNIITKMSRVDIGDQCDMITVNGTRCVYKTEYIKSVNDNTKESCKKYCREHCMQAFDKLMNKSPTLIAEGDKIKFEINKFYYEILIDHTVINGNNVDDREFDSEFLCKNLRMSPANIYIYFVFPNVSYLSDVLSLNFFDEDGKTVRFLSSNGWRLNKYENEYRYELRYELKHF